MSQLRGRRSIKGEKSSICQGMFTGVTSLFPPFPFLVCPRFFFLREFFSCALLFESLEQAKLVHVGTLLCIGQTYLVLVVVMTRFIEI